MKSIEISVPSSVSNLGRGLGQLGLALEAFRISIVVQESDKYEIDFGELDKVSYKDIKEIIDGVYNELRKGYGLKGSYKVILKEVFPQHYGLGLYEAITLATCYGLALIEEIELTDYEILMISSKYLRDAQFWDHLASSYYGGFVFINKYVEPPSLIRIEPPDWLEILLLTPRLRVSNWWRKVYDKVRDRKIVIDEMVKEASGLTTLIHGLMDGNVNAFIHGLRNDLLESVVYENYPYVKEIVRFLLSKGMLGYMVSRLGPSIVFFFDEHQVDINTIADELRSFIIKRNYPYNVYKTTWATGLSSTY